MPTTGRRANSAGTGGPRDEEANRRLKFFDMFLRSLPSEYAGKPDHDPLEAVEWLRRVKKCLNVIDVPEDLRVEFAVYTLTGAADYWWDFIKRSRDVDSITWAEFEELFLNKYFPPFLMMWKFEEFFDLTQGNMTVEQYEAKFIKLSWHASDSVSSDSAAVELFQRGLEPTIARRLASEDADGDKCNTYDEVVAKALWHEHMNDRAERKELQESSDGASGSGGKTMRKQQKGSQMTKSKPCTCFKCGQRGHNGLHCPTDTLGPSLR